jgi:hypothetical protein
MALLLEELDDNLLCELDATLDKVDFADVSLRSRLHDLCDECGQMMLGLAPMGARVQQHITDLERLRNLVENMLKMWADKPHMISLYCEGNGSPFLRLLTIQDQVQATLTDNVHPPSGSEGLCRWPEGH